MSGQIVGNYIAETEHAELDSESASAQTRFRLVIGVNSFSSHPFLLCGASLSWMDVSEVKLIVRSLWRMDWIYVALFYALRALYIKPVYGTLVVVIYKCINTSPVADWLKLANSLTTTQHRCLIEAHNSRLGWSRIWTVNLLVIGLTALPPELQLFTHPFDSLLIIDELVKEVRWQVPTRAWPASLS